MDINRYLMIIIWLSIVITEDIRQISTEPVISISAISTTAAKQQTKSTSETNDRESIK